MDNIEGRGAPAPVLSDDEIEGFAVIYRNSEARHLMSFENFLRVALIVRRRSRCD